MAEDGRQEGREEGRLGSLRGTPDLDRWVTLTGAGGVVIGTGKVELGQGIRTALTAIAADELGVDPSRVHVRSASTGSTPNEFITAGSGSIEQSGSAVRQACAHARRLLLAMAAERLGVDVAELSIDDGRVLAPDGAGVSYWELAPERPFDHRIVEPAPVMPAGAHRWVGVGLPRVDLPAKVRGAPVFVHDLRLPGMVHARVVRPPRPGCRLEVVVPPEDVAPAEMVRDGSFVAVVARREADAVRAADVVGRGCTWSGGDALDPEGDTPQHLTSRATSTAAIVDGSAVAEPPVEAADPDDGLATVRARYTKPYLLHGSIGPSAAVALAEGGRLQVWSHSQGIELLRMALAPVVGLDPDAITVTHMDGAGCYGHNGADDAALDAALVAMARPGEPVSLKWSRADEHGWEPAAPAMVVDLEAAVDDGRRIRRWHHDLYSPSHVGRPRPEAGRMSGLLASWSLDPPFDRPPPRPSGGFHGGAHRNADPLYRVGERGIVSHFVPDGAVRTSATRSLGAFANVFAIESFMDELAAAAGADPVAFRLEHLDDERARAVIEAAVEMAGGLVAPGGVDAPGRGLGFARYENVKAYVAVVAEVEVVPRSGAILFTRGWMAADAGEVIDPDGLVNQLEGGVVQATSWTLKERLGFDASGVTTRDWDTYPILSFSESPTLRTRLLDGGGPALGAGEASLGPAAGAIANAVAQATGARIRDLPMRPERVKAVLQALL